MLVLEKFLKVFNVQVSVNRVKPKNIDQQVSNLKSNDIYTEIKVGDMDILDLEKLSWQSLSIPGMIDAKSGHSLFTMCYLQKEKGDVIEIGSWQGRSTSFLARAVKHSGNGKLYAIDPFTGNVGKESFYVVGKTDLSDLKSNFYQNMEAFGLGDSVTLLPLKSQEAADKLKNIQVRFLFIDGDHTEEGVATDLTCFFPLLIKGGIIVFDDFLKNAEGLVRAIESHVRNHPPVKAFSFKKTLVLQY